MPLKTLTALAVITVFASGSALPHGAQRAQFENGRSYGYAQGNQLIAEQPRQMDVGHRHTPGCGHAQHEHHLHHHHHHKHDTHAQPNEFDATQPQYYPRNTPTDSVFHQPSSSQPFRPVLGGGTQSTYPSNSNSDNVTPQAESSHRFQPTRPRNFDSEGNTSFQDTNPYVGNGGSPNVSPNAGNRGFQFANPGMRQGASDNKSTTFDQNIADIFNTKESTPTPTYGGHKPASNPKSQFEEVMPDSINDRGLFDTLPKCADDEIAVKGHCRKMA